jgi:hypothetical protein
MVHLYVFISVSIGGWERQFVELFATIDDDVQNEPANLSSLR